MADEEMMELLELLRKRLDGAQPDAVRGMNQRNGYRTRQWDTRVGSMDLAVPKLRRGSYFPEWLLEPRRRSERAMVAVVTEAWVKGVSTRRVDDLVKTMGIEGISKSQVSELAKSLDEQVQAFRNRPLVAKAYPYMWLDALFVKSRENGGVVNVAVVVATAANADGYREVLGLDVMTTEDGAGWTAFLRGLVARGLRGVQLVTSWLRRMTSPTLHSLSRARLWHPRRLRRRDPRIATERSSRFTTSSSPSRRSVGQAPVCQGLLLLMVMHAISACGGDRTAGPDAGTPCTAMQRHDCQGCELGEAGNDWCDERLPKFPGSSVNVCLDMSLPGRPEVMGVCGGLVCWQAPNAPSGSCLFGQTALVFDKKCTGRECRSCATNDECEKAYGVEARCQAAACLVGCCGAPGLMPCGMCPG